MIKKYNNIQKDYYSELAKGNIAGGQCFNSFGQIETSSDVDRVMLQPKNTQFLDIGGANGKQLEIFSDSSNDTDGGSGIEEVVIHYLDKNLQQKEENLILNGTTHVNTYAKDIRFVNCMHTIRAGSLKQADGNISLTDGTNTFSYIASGENRCASSLRRVPFGKMLNITEVFGGSASGTADARTEINLFTTEIFNYDKTLDSIIFNQYSMLFQDNSGHIGFKTGLYVDEGVVIGMNVTSNKASKITGGFFGYLENK